MEKGIARYLFELGQLKRVKRSGWWVAGVDQPESVADHSFRCAAIAYVLAELEGANPERAATIALFHDTGETRVNDQHRVGKSYVDWSGAEEKVEFVSEGEKLSSFRERAQQMLETVRNS